MTRKLICAFLALVCCFSLVFSVSVNASSVDYVTDDFGYLADQEIAQLNEQAAAIRAERDVGIFFVYTTAGELKSFDVDRLVGGMENYYVMIENDTSWYSFLGGIANEYIDADTDDYLRSVYDQADTYVGGVADFLDAAAECFPYVQKPAETAPQSAKEYFLYDEADLLSDAEEAALERKLADISHSYQAQLVICTIASMNGGDIDAFDDYLYDSMGFGYGDQHDGVMLLVCMSPREYRILSNGFVGSAIDGSDIAQIGEEIVPDLSAGNYAASFDAFADQCAYYLEGNLNGFPFNFGKNLMVALIIGAVIGLIVAFVLKGQLKTVHKQHAASAYVKSGSMNVNIRNDIFLYRNVSRTKKPSSDRSSGGSSRSSGGGSF